MNSERNTKESQLTDSRAVSKSVESR